MNLLKLLRTNLEFYERVREDFTYHSAAIEGSTITKEQHAILAGLTYKQQISEANLGEVVKEDMIENYNCLKLFDYVFNHVEGKLTHESICNYQFLLKQNSSFHKNIPEETGKYRKINVQVGSFEAVPYYQIFRDMENLLQDYAIRFPILLGDIVEFHVRYESIHPFRDGNGRTGRMIAFKQCLQYDVIPFIVDNDTRQSYINAIYLSLTTYDYSSLIKYCEEHQRSFILKYKNYLIFNEEQFLSKNERKVITYLQKIKYANSHELQKILNLGSSMTKQILSKMVKNKILVIVGKARSSQYTLK